MKDLHRIHSACQIVSLSSYSFPSTSGSKLPGRWSVLPKLESLRDLRTNAYSVRPSRSRLGVTTMETLRIAKRPNIDVEAVTQLQNLVPTLSHSLGADQKPSAEVSKYFADIYRP